jgi:serine/threonine-protein kinase
MRDASRVAVDGRRIGPFTLEAVLGEGGMGIVYRGVRDRPAETVAVKVLKQALSSDEVYRRRFEREAQVAREVRHRHLVSVLESGDDRGVHYLAMAYVDGESLAERLDAGPLSTGEAARIVGEVAAGLDALHEHELVHRDVKPSNIMLAKDGTALLTDFGLARGRALTVLTRPGEVMGTLDYIAPELIRGEQASPASDIYALACVAYASLVGEPPFAGRGMFEKAAAHIDEDPPDPASRRPELPQPLSWGLLQGLAKDPARRPTTARAYARMLALGAKS